MPNRLILHPEAIREIEEAQDWYAERSSFAEDGFLADLNHAVQQVATAPLRWPRHKLSTRRFVFRHYPYTLIYRIYDDTQVWVLAVAHDSRRPGYWRSRNRET